MKLHRLTAREAFMSGMSPMPNPLGLAFSEALLVDQAQQAPGKQPAGQGAGAGGQAE